MADSYHIIDGKVVPYSGGRKCNDTGAWRDATPLELQLQEQLEEYENTIAAQAAEIERLRAEVDALREQEPVPSIPAGYKLVPAWPTPEWVQSAAKGIRITTIEHIINDVLAAAPEPPALNSHKMPQHSERHGDLRIDRLYADYYGDVRYD